MEDRKILALGVEISSLVLVQDTLKQQASTSGQHCLVNSYIYMLLMPACVLVLLAIMSLDYLLNNLNTRT